MNMERKKNRQGKDRKMTGQVKNEPRQESRSASQKPNKTNATDEQPGY